MDKQHLLETDATQHLSEMDTTQPSLESNVNQQFNTNEIELLVIKPNEFEFDLDFKIRSS